MGLEFLGIAEPELDESRLEFLGRAEEPATPPASLPPSITGPLIDTPRQKRRKEIQEFEAIPNIADNPLTSSEFGRGAAKGFLGMGSSVAGFGEALAQIIGADAAKEWLKEKGDKLEELEKNIPQLVDDFTGVESPSDLAAYVAMSFGKLAPQIATGMGGGLLAKGGAKGAEAGARIAAGAYATSLPQEAGGIYRGIRDETGEEAPKTALAFGAVSAGLEALPQARLLGRIFGGEAGEVLKREGWRGLVKQTFQEAKKNAALEGATEITQKGIALAANRFADSTYPLLTAKNGIRMLDSGLQGFIGGGTCNTHSR